MIKRVSTGKLPQEKIFSPNIKQKKKARKKFSVIDPTGKGINLNILNAIRKKQTLQKKEEKKIEEKKIEPGGRYTRKRNDTFYSKSKNVKINAVIERLMKNQFDEDENSQVKKKNIGKINMQEYMQKFAKKKEIIPEVKTSMENDYLTQILKYDDEENEKKYKKKRYKTEEKYDDSFNESDSDSDSNSSSDEIRQKEQDLREQKKLLKQKEKEIKRLKKNKRNNNI